MSGPLLFISHSTVKPGRLEAYQELTAEAIELVESEEPRIIAFNSYASEDGTDVSTVQVHPDAESLDTHLKIFLERLRERAFANLDSYEINVYGAPSAAALEMLNEMPSQLPGLRVRVLPEHEGGFLRPQPL
ncbi:MAG: hypothetical protein ACRDQF_18675 [Thermocrispum sp.]